MSSRDDFLAVLQKLGPPAGDHWQSESGAIQYRALSYPDRHYTVILMGQDRGSARYIGALDDHWIPVHSVELHPRGTTSSLLRTLRPF